MQKLYDRAYKTKTEINSPVKWANRNGGYMTKTHKIKLYEEFADAVLCGDKNFEIRHNDRGYQKGDHIIFDVVESSSMGAFHVDHPLNSLEYEITYVLSGWHIDQDYVVFGITPFISCEEGLDY